MRLQQGFSYVVVMFLVAVMSIVSVRALENTLTVERRQKEAELLRVGEAYRNAIKTYYTGTPGTPGTQPNALPKEVKELLLDQRASKIVRPLRKLYRDPITGSENWGYVHNADGRLIGVYSLSTLRPRKRDGFIGWQAGFKNAASYQDWKFVYDPTVN